MLYPWSTEMESSSVPCLSQRGGRLDIFLLVSGFQSTYVLEKERESMLIIGRCSSALVRPPEFRLDTLPQQPRGKLFFHFFYTIISISPRSTRINDLSVGSSPLNATEQARIWRDSRQAKVKGGNSRLNRITGAQNIPQ